MKRIFGYALDGHGSNYIRRRLEEQKVPCPTWWNRQRGLRSHFTKWEQADPENGRFIWNFTVIKDILINPVYTGANASQKTNYRFKLGTLSEKKPKEELRMKPITQATPTEQRKYIAMRCGAVLVGTGLLALCAVALAIAFYVSLFGWMGYGNLIFPAILTLLPATIFCLGAGLTLGRIHPNLIYLSPSSNAFVAHSAIGGLIILSCVFRGQKSPICKA